MRRLNRYAKKCRSKNKDHQRFLAHRWIDHSMYRSWDDFNVHRPPWATLVRPWQFYMSKSAYARSELQRANKKLRALYKNMSPEDEYICLPKRSLYKKHHDYKWMVW